MVNAMGSARVSDWASFVAYGPSDPADVALRVLEGLVAVAGPKFASLVEVLPSEGPERPTFLARIALALHESGRQRAARAATEAVEAAISGAPAKPDPDTRDRWAKLWLCLEELAATIGDRKLLAWSRAEARLALDELGEAGRAGGRSVDCLLGLDRELELLELLEAWLPRRREPPPPAFEEAALSLIGGSLDARARALLLAHEWRPALWPVAPRSGWPSKAQLDATVDRLPGLATPWAFALARAGAPSLALHLAPRVDPGERLDLQLELGDDDGARATLEEPAPRGRELDWIVARVRFAELGFDEALAAIVAPGEHDLDAQVEALAGLLPHAAATESSELVARVRRALQAAQDQLEGEGRRWPALALSHAAAAEAELRRGSVDGGRAQLERARERLTRASSADRERAAPILLERALSLGLVDVAEAVAELAAPVTRGESFARVARAQIAAGDLGAALASLHRSPPERRWELLRDRSDGRPALDDLVLEHLRADAR